MKKLLKELYIENKLSTHQIADQFDMDAKTVYRWLRKFGIKPRTKSEAMKGINKGRRNSRRGGRITDKRGYVLIYQPTHPNADNNGYIYEHRLVMEGILGRYLTKKEVIHHTNRIRNDNKPENLMLFSSFTKHMTFHKGIN